MPGFTPEVVTPSVNGDTYARIEYNGFKFPPCLRQSISSRSIPTTSGRSTKALVYVLTVECVLNGSDFATASPHGTANSTALGTSTLSGGDRLDPVMSSLIRTLLIQGRRLTIHGLGTGEIDIDPVNNTGNYSDIDNGPKPKIVDIQAITNARTVHLTWSVEFTISFCRNQPAFNSVTANEFEFSTHYTIDVNGMLTRNLYGRIGLVNWLSRNKVRFNVDSSQANGPKEIILSSFPSLPGFDRRIDFTTNPARTEIQFSITDTEIPSPNAYFPGTVRMNCSYTIKNDNSLAENSEGAAVKSNQGLNFSLSISGSIEVAPGRSKSWGWNALVEIVQNKLALIKNNYRLFFFGITEDIFGRTLTFQITYKSTFSLEKFFDVTKIFEPLNKSWEPHNTDRQDYLRAYGFNGDAILKPSEFIEPVLSLCDTVDPTPVTINSSTKDELQFKRNKPPAITTSVSTKDSYAAYNNSTRIVSTYNVAVHSVMSQGDANTNPQDSLESPATKMQGTSLESNRHKSEANKIQQQGTGEHYLIIEGSGMRVGNPVAIPYAESIEGMDGSPTLWQEDTIPSQLAGYTADGFPIYSASWRRVYCLPNLGSKVTLAAIPTQYQSTGAKFDTGGPTTTKQAAQQNK